MNYRKENFNGIEYHFPEHFKNVEEYLKSESDKVRNEDSSVSTEMQWDDIRFKRDRLIAETDKTQLLDSQLTKEAQAEFAEYRQALRDLPQNFDNPDDVIWPEKPEL